MFRAPLIVLGFIVLEAAFLGNNFHGRQRERFPVFFQNPTGNLLSGDKFLQYYAGGIAERVFNSGAKLFLVFNNMHPHT